MRKRKFLTAALALTMCCALSVGITQNTKEQERAAITASAAPATTADYDVNSDGTNDTAYKISTAADLLWFAEQVNGGNNEINGVLMNDIDLSTVCSATLGNWTPIGTETKNFKGSFDGRGFTVKNLYYNNTTDGKYVGLFGIALTLEAVVADAARLRHLIAKILLDNASATLFVLVCIA